MGVRVPSPAQSNSTTKRRELGKAAMYRDIPKLPPKSKFPPLEKDPFDTDDEIQQLSSVSGQSVTAHARQQLVARDSSFDDASFLD